MPEAVSQDRQALDWVADNPNSPQAGEIMQVLGVDSEDIQAWDYARKNPNDKNTTALKNVVFDKVARSNPAVEEQAVGFLDRFMIKNLISENTDLQENYLRKKGFETRRVGDRVEVRQPGQERFGVIDPEGFDLFDVTDLVGDAAEAIATAAATGAKALGFVGAPATGGGSLLAGSALGGAATGGFEAARQGVGIAAGLREEIDPGRIAQATAIGATVPGATQLAGKLFSGIGKGVRALSRAKMKPEAEAIEAAAQEIGAKATPGQLIDSATLQRLESAQAQSAGKLGGIGLRQQVQQNIRATQEAAEQIVKEVSGKTAFETGQEAGAQLTKELAERLKPAESIYQKYEGIFSRKAFKPDMGRIKAAIGDLKKEFRLDDKALGFIDNIDSKLPEIKNLDDVKRLRTLVRDSFDPMDKAKSRVVSRLGSELTEVRSDTLKRLAEERGGDFFDVAKKEIEQADSIYKGSINDIKEAILRPGQKMRMSPKKQLADFMERTPEIDRINKVLKTNDPKKIAAVKRAFPESFETLRQGKIQEIATRAETQGAVNPRKLANMMDKLPPETARLIFGAEAAGKAKALKTFLDSIPPMTGPSGTPAGLEIFRTFNVLSQAASVGRSRFSKLLENIARGKDIPTRLGRGLQTPSARGAAVFGVRQLTPPPRDNRGLQLNIPSRGLNIPQE